MSKTDFLIFTLFNNVSFHKYFPILESLDLPLAFFYLLIHIHSFSKNWTFFRNIFQIESLIIIITSRLVEKKYSGDSLK